VVRGLELDKDSKSKESEEGMRNAEESSDEQGMDTGKGKRDSLEVEKREGLA